MEAVRANPGPNLSVIDFYAVGGRLNPHLEPVIRPLDLSRAERAALVAFLRSFQGGMREGSAGCILRLLPCTSNSSARPAETNRGASLPIWDRTSILYPHHMRGHDLRSLPS